MSMMMKMNSNNALLARFMVRPMFIDQIKARQDADEFLSAKKLMAAENTDGEFRVR